MARKKTTATKRKVAKRKTTTRKRTTHRKVTKKTTRTAHHKAKRTVKAKKSVKKPAKLATSSVKKPMTKAQILSVIAEGTGLTRKETSAVFEALGVVIKRHIAKGGAGECTLPGLIKLKVVRKPAVKARKGINPFTGEPTIFKAKPAHNVVKARILKKLKEMAK